GLLLAGCRKTPSTSSRGPEGAVAISLLSTEKRDCFVAPLLAMTALGVFFGSLLVPSGLYAKGMALRFVDVVLERVAPGTSVNLRVFKNLPLVVLNNDDEDMDVAVEVVIPDAKEMKEGYEPIPDPTWIKIIPERYHLGPRASASSD